MTKQERLGPREGSGVAGGGGGSLRREERSEATQWGSGGQRCCQVQGLLLHHTSCSLLNNLVHVLLGLGLCPLFQTHPKVGALRRM